MSNISIKTIYDEYLGSYTNEPSFTIEFWNINSVFLNNVKTFSDLEQLRLYIELTWQYINAKFSKCHYNDICDFVSKRRLLIDSEIERLDGEKLRDNWYYGILFFSGMSSFNLKDYKSSTPLFKELVQYDQKNDNYKDWLNNSIYGQRLGLSRAITIISLILFFFNLIFEKRFFSRSQSLLIETIAFLGFIGTLGYEYFIQRTLRKNKSAE